MSKNPLMDPIRSAVNNFRADGIMKLDVHEEHDDERSNQKHKKTVNMQ